MKKEVTIGRLPWCIGAIIAGIMMLLHSFDVISLLAFRAAIIVAVLIVIAGVVISIVKGEF